MIKELTSFTQAVRTRLASLRKRAWSAREIAVRMLADAVMVNVALLSALILRYMWSVDAGHGVVSAGTTIGDFLKAYLSTFWIPTLIGMVVFYGSGFYTHGRAYAGRY